MACRSLSQHGRGVRTPGAGRGACAALVSLTAVLVAAIAGATPPTVPGIEPPPPARAPRVAAASDEPAAAAAAIGVPEGFTIELFAAEPSLANPVAFSIDAASGAVYVCEAFRAHKGVGDNVRINDEAWLDADLASRSVDDRFAFMLRLLGDRAGEWVAETDRVRKLVDADRDGRADGATVFADGFNRLVDGHAAGIVARGNDVWLACIPALYRLRDADGDGVADVRRVLHEGFGVRVAIQGHDLHGLLMGPDGRLWFSIGDRGYAVVGGGAALQNPESGAVFRCEPDGSDLEVVHTGLRNPQELAFDDLGNLFTVDNNTDGGDRTRLVWIVPGGDSGWRGPVQYLPDRGPFNREQWWRTAFPGQAAFIVPPLAHIGAGPAGFAACFPTGLPEHFHGRFLLADFRGAAATSAVRSFRIEPAGSAFEAVGEEETFRHVLATDVAVGPDGAIWVSDWVHGWDGLGKGRVWRFVPTPSSAAAAAARAREVDGLRDLLAGDWQALADGRLVTLLGHPDRRARLEAQWELARRGAIAPLAGALAAGALSARIHAAWGLEQIARRLPDDHPDRLRVAGDLAAAAADPAWQLRMVAARMLGEIGAGGTAVRAAPLLAARLDDEHPHVRGAAALALGRIAGRTPGLSGRDALTRRVVAALEAEGARQTDADPHARHPLVMALLGVAARDALPGLLGHPDRTVRLAAVLALRRHADPAIAAALADAAVPIAVEAARAIHDVPIRAALAPLAARLPAAPREGSDGDAFLRRALAAAERTGTPEAARLVADAACTATLPAARRLEALDVLATWGQPRPRDRVIGAWRPFTPRDPAPARDAVAAVLPTLLAASDEAVRTRGLEVAATLGIDGVVGLLADTAGDEARPAASRAQALDALGLLDGGAAATVARRLAGDRVATVRTASRRIRAAGGDDPALVAELATVCGAHAESDDELHEQQAAIGLLGRLDSAAAREALEPLAARVAVGGDPRLRLEILVAAAAQVPEGVRKRIEDAGDDLLEGGDPRRGEELFFHRAAVECVRCHRVGAVGGEVGPRLDGIGARRDRAYLLESIRAPDARIAEGYKTTVVVTADGRTEAGILRAETEAELTLLRADGSIVRIATADVEARRDGASAMPAELAERLSRAELRDLVAWLATLCDEPPAAALPSAGGGGEAAGRR
ncbi:MAG: PVC-type heme-binding CxxCH protein [Planctomycetaceae bacterium]